MFRRVGCGSGVIEVLILTILVERYLAQPRPFQTLWHSRCSSAVVAIRWGKAISSAELSSLAEVSFLGHTRDT